MYSFYSFPSIAILKTNKQDVYRNLTLIRKASDSITYGDKDGNLQTITDLTGASQNTSTPNSDSDRKTNNNKKKKAEIPIPKIETVSNYERDVAADYDLPNFYVRNRKVPHLSSSMITTNNTAASSNTNAATTATANYTTDEKKYNTNNGIPDEAGTIDYNFDEEDEIWLHNFQKKLLGKQKQKQKQKKDQQSSTPSSSSSNKTTSDKTTLVINLTLTLPILEYMMDILEKETKFDAIISQSDAYTTFLQKISFPNNLQHNDEKEEQKRQQHHHHQTHSLLFITRKSTNSTASSLSFLRESDCQNHTQKKAFRTQSRSISDAVYQYWVNKRCKLRKPLLRQYWPVTATNDTNPHMVFRPREKEKYKLRKKRQNDIDAYRKLLLLKQDFEKLLVLCNLLKKREYLQRDKLKWMHERFEQKLYDCVDTSGLPRQLIYPDVFGKKKRKQNDAGDEDNDDEQDEEEEEEETLLEDILTYPQVPQWLERFQRPSKSRSNQYLNQQQQYNHYAMHGGAADNASISSSETTGSYNNTSNKRKRKKKQRSSMISSTSGNSGLFNDGSSFASNASSNDGSEFSSHHNIIPSEYSTFGIGMSNNSTNILNGNEANPNSISSITGGDNMQGDGSSGLVDVSDTASSNQVPLFTHHLPSRQNFITSWNDCTPFVPSYENGIPTKTHKFKHRGRIGRGGRIVIDRLPITTNSISNTWSTSGQWLMMSDISSNRNASKRNNNNNKSNSNISAHSQPHHVLTIGQGLPPFLPQQNNRKKKKDDDNTNNNNNKKSKSNNNKKQKTSTTPSSAPDSDSENSQLFSSEGGEKSKNYDLLDLYPPDHKLDYNYLTHRIEEIVAASSNENLQYNNNMMNPTAQASMEEDGDFVLVKVKDWIEENDGHWGEERLAIGPI